MKSKFTLIGLLILALGLVITMPGAMANDDGDDLGGGFGFGQRIAGTYFNNVGPFGGTLTLNADGTVGGAISGSCCGNAGNVQSEAFGNWVRTGIRQIELRTVVIGTTYNFDLIPPDGPDGNFIATPMVVLEFAEDFNSFEGELCTQVWFYELGGQMPDVNYDMPDLALGPFPGYNMSRLPVFIECAE
jgi:hypothetical protein